MSRFHDKIFELPNRMTSQSELGTQLSSCNTLTFNPQVEKKGPEVTQEEDSVQRARTHATAFTSTSPPDVIIPNQTEHSVLYISK